MDHNYEDIILLERYLEQSLNEVETREVEKRLSQEQSFRDLFQNEKLLVNGIRYSHLKARLDELKKLEIILPAFHQEETNGKVIDFTAYWKVIAVAATLAITIGAFFMLNRSMTTEELFARYYAPYPNVFVGVTRGSIDKNPWAEVYAAYDRKDFEKAAKGFNEMWKVRASLKPEDRPEILLLMGNSNLMLGKTEEARDNFITLSKDFNGLDDQAQWFLSLCYLKMGNKEAAKVLFEEIAGGDSSYKDKAKELLKKL